MLFGNKNVTLPNLITLASAASGLFGLFLISKDKIIFAIIFLTACDIFDTLDGVIARKFRMFSPIGQDLDSLVDAIVFLVPPFMLLMVYQSLWISLSSILVVFAGLYRLARYNVEPSRRGYVKGLIASQPAHYLYLAILLGANTLTLGLICLVGSILMVVPVYTPEKYTNWASRLMIVCNLGLSVTKLIS